ncbi:hypothetical protein N7539_003148 [Penicillium diatomitis]|uniref:ATPase AAA-type core domain-containing protein n=1 Tax=Penicillium diatomitis TaxID=2819901 RepID=A0A9W9XG98_9EURO|nr:uncharacterized protein N7539_003148 [Penicillium diatomitis]KAJ5491581.1 hypothetical protein N7539_003148 [Penicillium diatomitis]
MNKGKAIKVNLNYFRPLLRDLGVKDKDGIVVIDIGAILMEDREREKERMQGDGVDVQKLSETDFLVGCLTCVVSALRDVDWLPESFDCLQIPSENKILLLLMAKTRLDLIPTVLFDDYLSKCLYYTVTWILTCASGLPGVGKIFTVELEFIFKIVKYFKAVLLLDEADAFMSFEEISGRLFCLRYVRCKDQRLLRSTTSDDWSL